MITQISQIIIFDQIKAALGNRLLIKTPTLCIGIRYMCVNFMINVNVFYMLFIYVFFPLHMNLWSLNQLFQVKAKKKLHYFQKQEK